MAVVEKVNDPNGIKLKNLYWREDFEARSV
jgi:hypothetical protein